MCTENRTHQEMLVGVAEGRGHTLVTPLLVKTLLIVKLIKTRRGFALQCFKVKLLLQ